MHYSNLSNRFNTLANSVEIASWHSSDFQGTGSPKQRISWWALASEPSQASTYMGNCLLHSRGSQRWMRWYKVGWHQQFPAVSLGKSGLKEEYNVMAGDGEDGNYFFQVKAVCCQKEKKGPQPCTVCQVTTLIISSHFMSQLSILSIVFFCIAAAVVLRIWGRIFGLLSLSWREVFWLDTRPVALLNTSTFLWSFCLLAYRISGIQGDRRGRYGSGIRASGQDWKSTAVSFSFSTLPADSRLERLPTTDFFEACRSLWQATLPW